MKLKIFSDTRSLPAGMEHVAMLYPFWGKYPEDPQDPNSGRYDRYVELGRELWARGRRLDQAIDTGRVYQCLATPLAR